MSAVSDARNAVIHSEEMDIFAARDTAAAWHGGQTSALYSFASTDCTVHSEQHKRDLIHEVHKILNKITDEGEAEKVENLHRVIMALPVEDGKS